MFKLSDLLEFDDIVIQCHDHPDADAVSSAFGVYSYLKRQGKDARMIYGGMEKIKKRNIVYMLEWLNIPIAHVKDAADFPAPGLLICVDCQYGEGNVAKLPAMKVAVIDHHRQVSEDFDLGIIQPHLGACATIVWDLLRKEGFDFGECKDVPAALYYGLLTDTNNFSEINHPLDKDMRDSLQEYCDRGIVKRLSQCNLTMEELEITGVAMLRSFNDPVKRYAVLKTEDCDPNILGIISDTALQVDTVDLCVVYSMRANGIKLSIRSCAREAMASEFAEYITRGVGNGGGHINKAGGFINRAKIDEMGITVDEYMRTKTAEYFDSYDIIDASNHNIDTSKLGLYTKKPIARGFVLTTDLYEEGTPLMIRTLESDCTIKASPDMYIMIGVLGEAYPTKAAKFNASYRLCDEPVDLADDIYTPTVKNEMTGETIELTPHMKSCMPTSEAPIYAMELGRSAKVFTEWNPDGYMYGSAGDFLAIQHKDINDMYVIRREIFFKTYERIDCDNILP